MKIIFPFLSFWIIPLMSFSQISGVFTKDKYDVFYLNEKKLVSPNLNNLEWMFDLSEGKWKSDMESKFEYSDKGFEEGCPYFSSGSRFGAEGYSYSIIKCPDKISILWRHAKERGSLLDNIIDELEPYKTTIEKIDKGFIYSFSKDGYSFRILVARESEFEFVVFSKYHL